MVLRRADECSTPYYFNLSLSPTYSHVGVVVLVVTPLPRVLPFVPVLWSWMYVWLLIFYTNPPSALPDLLLPVYHYSLDPS
jgi:hypothetical protein